MRRRPYVCQLAYNTFVYTLTDRLTVGLAGNDWYSLKKLTTSGPKAILTVGYSRHPDPKRVEWISIIGPASSHIISAICAKSIQSGWHLGTGAYSQNPSNSLSAGFQQAQHMACPSPSWSLPPGTPLMGNYVHASAVMTYTPSAGATSVQSLINAQASRQALPIVSSVGNQLVPSSSASTKSDLDAKYGGQSAALHPEIVIRNLNFQITENELKDKLTTLVGAVEKYRIQRGSGRKCSGFVTFARAADADLAKQRLHKTIFLGREVSIEFTKEGYRGPIIVDGSS